MSENQTYEMTNRNPEKTTLGAGEESILDEVQGFFSTFRNLLTYENCKYVLGVAATVVVVGVIVIASFSGCSEIKVKNHTFDTISVESKSPYRVEYSPRHTHAYDTLTIKLHGEHGKVRTDEGTFDFHNNGQIGALT